MDRQAIQERFGIIGTSAPLMQTLDRVRQVARTEINVLIEGESGVGKELFAQAMHELSERRHKPLVVVNCGAIPEGLIESELFGNEKGAYTGAVERRSGYFEEADGGTIFLDEIGEMPLLAQVRLLRVLETGTFSRVGSATVRKTDVRVIAATNKNLGREVAGGRFREDLYYRLSTVVLRVPALRERRADILPIFEHYLHRFTQKYNSSGKRLTTEAQQLLQQYRWPGNVRELRNVAEQSVVLIRQDEVVADALRPYLRGVTAGSLVPVSKESSGEPTGTRERELVYRALLELRLEIRELKEQVARLVSADGPLIVPRAALDPETQGKGFIIVRDADPENYEPFIEDVAYEIEQDEARTILETGLFDSGRPNRTGGDGRPGDDRPDDPEDMGDLDTDDDLDASTDPNLSPLPTLEDAERQLIDEALRRFEGNRRQSARALGISERTLYRKIKDMEG